MFKLIVRSGLTISFLALLVLTFLVLGNIYTYSRLTNEKPIAQLTFTPVNVQEFGASLRLGDFCEQKKYKIYGDEFRLDAQFLKWKSWATLFGLNAMYRIERLSGRYANIEDENTKIHIAHELKSSSTLNLSQYADRYNNIFLPVDTVYGSSAYKKMKSGVLFTLFRTQSGILIREQDLTIATEQRDCVSGQSLWKDTIVTLDQKLTSLVHKISL
ncbi:hypothetical protein [Candidatus Nitrospira salsa]